MVRERGGDGRSVWRLALGGVLASVLVVATSQTAVVAPLFYALQDQLFPAPPPSSQVTLVALDSTAATPFGPYPWGNDIHAKVINYLASLVVLAAYALLAVVLGRSGWLVDPIYTPVAIVLAAGFSLAARYVLVERERRKVERIFGHWVDPRIAEQLASSRSVEDIISKGERRDITLLFVDIRGFTALSEGMSAEDVQAVIHEYLDDMSTLILKWDGTIDKYVGDEIVALWNAPVDQRDHALLAVRCAYDLVNHAPILEARLAEKGLPPISWGIGVNTGPAVVGNMGSKDRL